MEQSWGMDLVRNFFASIDRAVYGLMATLYQIMIDLANLTILNADVVKQIYSRVYSLLGIFMLFKLSFSFINYIINPDQFTDKSKGVAKLVKNVMIVLVLMIMTPTAFNVLRELQKAILDQGLINNLVFDTNDEYNNNLLHQSFMMNESCEESGIPKSDGDYMALVSLRPFLQPDVNVKGEKIELSSDFKTKSYCLTFGTLEPRMYLREDLYNATKNGNYVIDYKFFLSTIVGIVVCVILVSFCFDIGIRSITLAFLELIAPVPIMAYIDPTSSSKDGVTSKYFKKIISTWVSLFVRLFAIYFAIFIVSLLDSLLLTNEKIVAPKFWVMLFLLLAALMFAKSFPKLLEELFPFLKLGGFKWNPFKRVKDEALFGKQLTGAAVGLGAMATTGLLSSASNMTSFALNRHRLKDKIAEAVSKGKLEEADELRDKLSQYHAGRALATGFGGLAGGMRIGMMSGYKTGAGGSPNIFKGTGRNLKKANDARERRATLREYNRSIDYKNAHGQFDKEEEYRKARYDFTDRYLRDPLYRFSGTKNDEGGIGYADEKIKELQRKIDDNNQAEASARNALAAALLEKNMNINLFQQYHKLMSKADTTEKQNEALDKFKSVLKDFGIATQDYKNTIAQYQKEYQQFKPAMGGIESVNKETKTYEKQLKAFKQLQGQKEAVKRDSK